MDALERRSPQHLVRRAAAGRRRQAGGRGLGDQRDHRRRRAVQAVRRHGRYRLVAGRRQVGASIRVAGREEPGSTNFDLYQLDGGRAAPKNLTGQQGQDAGLVFSADGKTSAELRMEAVEVDRFA